jgi:peptide deformylase
VRVLINPLYLEKSKTTVAGIPGGENKLEGCLSIPGIWGIVTRHEWVKVRYINESGKTEETAFADFEAIIVQHEMDHLDGILFTRRVVEQKGKLYKTAVDVGGKEVLEPLEL